MSDEVVIFPMPPDRYTRIQQEAEAQEGLSLPGYSGVIQHAGAQGTYQYVPPAEGSKEGTLTIDVHSGPKVFGIQLMTVDAFVGKLRSWIESVQ
jgi:hypothetical protein